MSKTLNLLQDILAELRWQREHWADEYGVVISEPNPSMGCGIDIYKVEPVAFVPGDLVAHPEYGGGVVHHSPSRSYLTVVFGEGDRIWDLDEVADKLTLIRRAPWSEVRP